MLEGFKSCVPDNVKTHLEEQQVRELHQAAALANDYVLTHKTDFTKGNYYPNKRRVKQSSSCFPKLVDGSKPDGGDPGTCVRKETSNKPTVTCCFL